MGLGAIFAATQLPRARQRWNRDGVASIGSVLSAFSLGAVALAPNPWIAAPAMFVGGIAWILVANSVTIAAQLALPDWVRARGMAILPDVDHGRIGAGRGLWGKLAELDGVP